MPDACAKYGGVWVLGEQGLNRREEVRIYRPRIVIKAYGIRDTARQ
jgi:hypothetical protein